MGNMKALVVWTIPLAAFLSTMYLFAFSRDIVFAIQPFLMIGLLHPFILIPITFTTNLVYNCLFGSISAKLSKYQRLDRLFTFSMVPYLATIVFIQYPLRHDATNTRKSLILKGYSFSNVPPSWKRWNTNYNICFSDLKNPNLVPAPFNNSYLPPIFFIFTMIFLIGIHLMKSLNLNFYPPIPLKMFFLGQLNIDQCAESASDDLENEESNELMMVDNRSNKLDIRMFNWKVLFLLIFAIIWVVLIICSPKIDRLLFHQMALSEDWGKEDWGSKFEKKNNDIESK